MNNNKNKVGQKNNFKLDSNENGANKTKKNNNCC